MASGTISLTRSGNGAMAGQIVWSSKTNGTAANSSTVTGSIQIRKLDAYTTTGTWKGSLTVGPQTQNVSWYGELGSSWVTVATVTATVSHSSNGAGSCYISGKINGPSETTCAGTYVSGSSTVTLESIPRQATLTSATNFNDEENPSITYSNPIGSAVPSLQAGISLDNTSDCEIAYRNVDKTAGKDTIDLTDAERDILRAAVTNGNTRTVWIYLRTRIGETYYYSPLSRTLTIKNPNPTLSPTVIDTNAKTIALTGDSSKLIRYHSNAAVTIGATAVKKATIASKKVTCGDSVLTSDGTINAVETNNFIFTATDSRGNTVNRTVTPSFVEYVKLTCNLGNNMPDTTGKMTVNVSGNYFNGSFGEKSNSLKVYYRYKVANGSYSDWTAMTPSINDNTYSATAIINGLDYQTNYVFQAYAEDELMTVNTGEKTVKSTPVFDWSGQDFQFNVPVYDKFKTAFNNGLASYSGGGDSGIDPNATLEELCLTSHTNAPQGLGTFYYIHTVFYNTKSETAARAQVAFPYNKNGSMYHRYYASGSWSGWKRYMTVDEVYPVNSIYISYSHTSPAELFGGTWYRIQSRFLWGTTTEGTIGATGGEQTHTLTVAEMPQHRHTTNTNLVNAAGSGTAAGAAGGADRGFAYGTAYSTSYQGSGSAHNNMPPYVNVAIWRRTA